MKGEDFLGFCTFLKFAQFLKITHPRANLDTVANITLYCKEQIKYKQLRLYSRELEKSVEVKLDNHFEIMEYYNQTGREIVASITPRNCPRICWTSELVADVPNTRPPLSFQRPAAHSCEQIEPVSTKTMLREYASYEVRPPHMLVIHTNYSDLERGAERREADAYVQLTATPVGRVEI